MTPTSPSSRVRLTPSETTRSASTSRPESVSRPAISVLTSLTQVRSLGASPLMAVAAVRRKFDTETPGTSTGYCMARNRPARARSSTVIARTSSPSRVTVPPVIVYFGWPAIEYARVDLPDPFGPMIAWVSPDRTVRVTPRRISLASSPSPTVTCRSRISRTDTLLLAPSFTGREREAAVGFGVDQHVLPLHADRVDVDRLGGRQVGGLAGAQVEARPVQPALDGGGAVELLDVALGQRDLGVRADVLDRVDLALEPDDGDVDVGQLHPQGAVLGHLGECADPLEGHGSGHLDRLLVEAGQRTETGLDGAHQPVLQLVDADALDDVGEEATDDEAARGLGVDAPGAEVEQLLVVEAAGGAGVAGADDLAGLDLQVGHRVGAGAVGEHQVAVELVGVGAGGRRPDADVADPDGARALAVHRAGRPVLHRDEVHRGAVADQHGHAAGVARQPAVVEHDRGLREGADLD